MHSMNNGVHVCIARMHTKRVHHVCACRMDLVNFLVRRRLGHPAHLAQDAPTRETVVESSIAG